MPTKPTNDRRGPDNAPGRYDHRAIEACWQEYWEKHQTFRTPNPGDPGFDADKPKFYVLDFFPYPSGAGLHVGHPLGYCATDIVARYKRMRGFNVLHPMGFDAFGLPAEQYAIAHNVHPAVTTRKNIDTYRRQLKMLGFCYDWSREFATCDPSYYKYTQWIFARMFDSWYDDQCRWTGPDGCETVGRARPISELRRELDEGKLDWRTLPEGAEFAGVCRTGKKIKPARSQSWKMAGEGMKRQVIDSQRLAYLADVQVNWCPALGTVLANEEVDNQGRSDRGGHPVFRRPLRQWMLRITKYADRLLADLDELDWPDSIKLMQRNWIGKSTGAEAVFPLAHRWTWDGGQWKDADGKTVLGAEVYDHADAIRVYTTRPDTLFGATYMVLAPEHPLVDKVTTGDRREAVNQYVKTARNRTDLERTTDTKKKTGEFTGGYAINPVNDERIPIWIADYVMLTYGTGAIMAVPGHDERDFVREGKIKVWLPSV